MTKNNKVNASCQLIILVKARVMMEFCVWRGIEY